MDGPRDFTVTLTAGQTFPLRARGRFFGILDAPAGALQLAFDGGVQQTRGAGGTVWIERGFREIDITSAFAQTIRVVVADQAQAIPGGGGGGGSGAGSGVFNTLPAGGDITLGAAGVTLLAAADSTRVGIAITNLDGNPETIRVGGSASLTAAQGLPVAPGDMIVLDTNAAVYAFNPGAAQDVAVLPLRQV